MYRTTTNCTTAVSLSEMLLKRKIRTTLDTPLYDRSKWHGPASLWPRCREKKRNLKIPWIIKRKEIDIAEGDRVLINDDVKNKQILSSYIEAILYEVVSIKRKLVLPYREMVQVICVTLLMWKRTVNQFLLIRCVNQMMFMLNPLNPMPDVSVISRPVRIRKVPSRFKDYLTKTL